MEPYLGNMEHMRNPIYVYKYSFPLFVISFFTSILQEDFRDIIFFEYIYYRLYLWQSLFQNLLVQKAVRILIDFLCGV